MINSLNHVCWAEWLKLRRSKAPVMTALAYAMAPVAAALLLLAGHGPLRAGLFPGLALGPWISAAQADWPGYFGILAGATAVGGLIVFGLFMIWIFGREHADRTSKELLTLPIAREALVAGKILVAALWCVVLQCGMLVVALILGLSLNLPHWSNEALQAGVSRMAWVCAMTFSLALPFGLAANLSRGIMGAVGALFMSLFFALVITALGWGAYFPWSIPALYSGAIGEFVGRPSPLSLWLVSLTGLAGALGNMAWWRWADQR